MGINSSFNTIMTKPVAFSRKARMFPFLAPISKGKGRRSQNEKEHLKTKRRIMNISNQPKEILIKNNSVNE